MAICAVCGEESPDRYRFCGACGAPLADARGEIEERKVVSVLFCDLVGFTGRSEHMDVEDVRGTLAPYHALLRRELERFGGTVEKFIGDAVMALFGAPTAHEDDAERAVRAALAIREEIASQNEQDGGDLHVRIGVNTGEALVVVGADPGRGEGMASGDVVNTAARLQATAPVDGILVGEGTFRATDRTIVYHQRGDVSAKGKSDPVSAWEATEARSRVAGDSGIRQTPLVGRTHEVGLLSDALRRVRAEHRPQLVTLVGVPGIGKSRLVWELLRKVEDETDFTYWRQGRSLPYGDGVTFWALGEMVKAQAGILDSDSADEAATKLREAVSDHIADTGEAAWVEGHLLPLIGTVGDHSHAGSRGREAASAWRRFLESLAERHPLVLVFEDMHWADEQLLDFIDYLVDWAADVPMLVLCTARPELLDRRAGWGGGKRNALTVALSSMADDDIARLIAVLLEQAALPAETQSLLLSAAEGTPLYAEEYVRMLIDRGHLIRDGARWKLVGEANLPVPESVQALIAARLDGLPVEEKRTLQDAATVGKVFWLGALATIGGTGRPQLEEQLHRLERRDFVYRERRAAIAGEAEYAFRHVLVRDAAYGQIPRAQRAAKHRLAAEWVESISADREDTAEMLAHHYGQALSYARDIGDPVEQLVPRVRRALVEAADRASALNALDRAFLFYTQALELWPEDDVEHARLLVRMARIWNISHTKSPELERARDRLIAAGERQLAGLAEMAMTGPLWNEGRADEVFAHQARARELLEGTEPTWEKAYALNWMAINAMLQDSHDDAMKMAGEANGIAESLGFDEIRAQALNTLGVTTFRMGRPEAGRQMIEESIGIAEQLNDGEALLRARKNLASLLCDMGELEPANALYLVALEEARRFGDDYNVEWFQAEIAIVSERRGEWDSALEGIHALLDARAPESLHYMEAALRESASRIRLGRGDIAGALADATAAAEFGRTSGDSQIYFPALAAAVRANAASGRIDDVRTLAEELASVAGGDKTPSYWPVDLALGLIDTGLEELLPTLNPSYETPWLKIALALLGGDHLAAATTSASIGAKPYEAEARMLAAQRLMDQGQRAAGEEEAQRVLAIARAIGAQPLIARGEALLAATA